MAEISALARETQGQGQSGLRGRNARTILTLLRRSGTLPSADIARQTGLSAQTVSNIIRSLESDGVLSRGDAVRGKVGKPSVPVAINPRGAHALGLSIGRRAVELVLVDLLGHEVGRRLDTYAYPTLDRVARFLARARRSLLEDAPGVGSSIVGLGVAAPFGLWNWLDHVDAPAAAMDEWRNLDITGWIAAETGLDVVHANDATSACVAEHLLGRGRSLADFGYIFIGAFVGGGMVTEGRVMEGPSGNTGALGPMLVPRPGGGMTQLLDVVSLFALERQLAATGADVSALRSSDAAWHDHDRVVRRWIDATAPNLGIAAIGIGAVIEVEAVVIDGAMPAAYRRALVEKVRQSFEALPTTGIELPRVIEGEVGRSARSIGAALLPINAKFFAAT